MLKKILRTYRDVNAMNNLKEKTKEDGMELGHH